MKIKYLFLILSLALLTGCGECDKSKEHHVQFKQGDMVKAKVDGKIGQVYVIDGGFSPEQTFYKIRFESDKEGVWLKEYEVEKAN